MSPSLPPDEVHVWTVALDVTPEERERLSRVLSVEEHERAAGMGHEGRRAAFVVARAALRTILGRYCEVDPEGVRLRYAPGGKPELDGAGELRFNVSHSGAIALCAVARKREVGVDVEQVRERYDIMRIAERFFSVREYRALVALEDDARRTEFFRCWTRREAYCKARGESLFGAPQIEVAVREGRPRLVRVEGRPEEPLCWILYDLEPSPDYVATVAARGGDFAVTRLQL